MKYFSLLRPKHWIKNLFLFAAPFFGGNLFSKTTLLIALPAFMAFSLCASAVYIFNDIQDVEYDRLHPKKKKRPVASGSINKNNALFFAFILASLSFVLSYEISTTFVIFILFYLAIQVLYSLFLKNMPVFDIFCIASGFVIRVLAGGSAFHVEVSRWLLLTMFMISLVLASGKRLAEVKLLQEKAEEHRKSLDVYSISTLKEILLISSSGALIAYALYTVEQYQNLVYTVPIVTFGLFRYLLLSKKGNGDPTDALTYDKWLAVTVILWLFMIGFLRYNY
jgi:decaprenyl-phosphate phosphoribosyltransferase